MKDYLSLAHAMQTGIKYVLELDGSLAEPKHVRVGISLTKVEHGALVQLLIDKGIISLDEYDSALLGHMQAEVDSYEKYLSDKLGKKIILL